ncbi:MAG: flagellar hook capping protein [Roseburia sp.]|nr:flagellar hook capping protein [Roseburia sp.]
MALLMQEIKNGKVVETETLADKADKASKELGKNSGLDKQAFLQLLVAQMQYQDPLEPMDNTEYISQLATFSTLEEMQNMRAATEQSYANNLVGKYVILNTDSGTVHGKVDYVMYEKGNIFLAVNDGLYSIEDLDTVADSTYYEAVEMANLFSSLLAAMPSAKEFNSGNMSDFEKIKTLLESMNVYQQNFISEDDAKKYKELLTVYEQLKGNTSSNTSSTGNTGNTGGTENTGKDDLKDE